MIPALIRKCVRRPWTRARGAIEVWGTGAASREFLYVDGRGAAASCLAAERYDGDEPVNLGAGFEITHPRSRRADRRADRAFEGEVRWDPTKPDGQPRRSLDTSRAERLLRLPGCHELRGRAPEDHRVVQGIEPKVVTDPILDGSEALLRGEPRQPGAGAPEPPLLLRQPDSAIRARVPPRASASWISAADPGTSSPPLSPPWRGHRHLVPSGGGRPPGPRRVPSPFLRRQTRPMPTSWDSSAAPSTTSAW